VNLLANILSPTKRIRRLDALHIKSNQWQTKQAKLFATKPFAELAGKPFFCSDHFGLLVEIEHQTLQILPTTYFTQVQPTYHTALVWIPPQATWQKIQEIRALHDSKYERWLPHITLIYGFIPENLFEDAVALIAEAVTDLQPFEIELQNIQSFEHRQSFTAWLQPDAKAIQQFQALQTKLQTLFPTCDEQSNKPNGFTPHLSLGQFDSLENLQKIIPLWKALKTQVSEIVLQSREKETPFTIRYKVLLGQQKFIKVIPTWQMPVEVFMPLLTLQDKKNRETVVEIIQQACLEVIPQTVQIEQMGSTALGIATPQSDIDVVCIIPKDVERIFFLSKLQNILSLFATSTRLVEDAQIPILKLVINDVAIDILVAQSPVFPVVFSLPAFVRQQSKFDTLSWQILSGVLEVNYILKTVQEIVNIEQFRLYVRTIRAWAKARGLIGNGWGYLGSYSWTILVVNAILAYPKHGKSTSLEDFITFFFKMYAQHDWKEAIALTQVGKTYKANTKRDKMPIITNIEPCFNSAKNVTRSTFKHIKTELNRAHHLTKKSAQESSWESLLDKREIVGKPNSTYFEIKIKTSNLNVLTQSVGWLEGNIISLFVDLEQDENLILEFLPTLYYDDFQAIFKVWIVAENLNIESINNILQSFAHKFDIPQAKLLIEKL
jgi:2'-5' RNA ligase